MKHILLLILSVFFANFAYAEKRKRTWDYPLNFYDKFEKVKEKKHKVMNFAKNMNDASISINKGFNEMANNDFLTRELSEKVSLINTKLMMIEKLQDKLFSN